MKRYQVLVGILDQLRREAPVDFKSYHVDEEDINALNDARAKAFIHLLLKVYFGLVEFQERHEFVTEGSGDGGIDAYFIDSTTKIIYFIQSKFRQTQQNFEGKSIEPEELLAMDINRILDGEWKSENGSPYNSKIQNMAKRINAIEDIGRYSYQVVILANAKGLTRKKSAQLTGGFNAEVFDYERCYNELVFPLISGTFFRASELQLTLVLSDKNAGSKISYTVRTEFTDCEITVVFVPTIEIARAMDKYRNSILKFNPRSYLEHRGKNVNSAIRSSIEDVKTNEFALFNNGITVLSDQTFLNERIGQKDRAQLVLVNPQIINGGQTAFTLSRVYREQLNNNVEELFANKEVLMKVITFSAGDELDKKCKESLIDSISAATNKQSVVSYADRRSNEPEFEKLQQKLFEKAGVILERKTGEFGEGIRDGYLKPSDVIDRNDFARIAYTIVGDIRVALKKRIIASVEFSKFESVDDETYDQYRIGIEILPLLRLRKNKKGHAKISYEILQQMMAGIYILQSETDPSRERVVEVAELLKTQWEDFSKSVRVRNDEFKVITKKGNEVFDWKEYYASPKIKTDLIDWFSLTKQETI